MSKLGELAERIRKCKECGLHENRTSAVPGEGPKTARIMFVGEGPGYWEDQKGIPFCGKAGGVLDELLEHVGLSREEVFITNIVKCRPPNNRAPTKEEKSACKPYLNKQISLVNPRALVSLGNHATKSVFNKYGLEAERISLIKGKVFKASTLRGVIKIIPQFHPAVAVYNPNQLDELKKDFEKLNPFI